MLAVLSKLEISKAPSRSQDAAYCFLVHNTKKSTDLRIQIIYVLREVSKNSVNGTRKQTKQKTQTN
jgi:hypothetical protein